MKTQTKDKPRQKARVIKLAPNRYNVPSNTRRHVFYEVTVSEHGVYSCCCAASTYRRGQLCNHARQVMTVREFKLAQEDTAFNEWIAEQMQTEEEQAAEQAYWDMMEAAADYADYVETCAIAEQADCESPEWSGFDD